MNKTEFSDALRRALGKLPSYEVEQSIAFYLEMIDDRMEDGMSEADVVAALGPVGAIAAQIIAETPVIPKAIAKANTGSRTLNVVLLVVFSPIWVPVALALVMAALMVYLSIWMVVVALWATVATLLLCGPIGIVGLVWCLATGYPLMAAWLLGCGLAAAGTGLFALFGVLAASKGLVQLTHSFARWIKGLFVKQVHGSGQAAPPYAPAPGSPSVPVAAGAPPAPPYGAPYPGAAYAAAPCPGAYPPATAQGTIPFPTAPSAPAAGNPAPEGAQSHDHRA